MKNTEMHPMTHELLSPIFKVADSRLGLLHLEGNNLKQQESREQESKASVSPLFGTVQTKIDNLEMKQNDNTT
jgi:hypothetical protein